MSEMSDQQTALVKPAVVGIFGVSGSGKSSLLNRLSNELGHKHFLFIEGSEVIGYITPGGLDSFKSLDNAQKENLRELAIEEIGRRCSISGKAGVVTGHWNCEADAVMTKIWTKKDSEIYTHIIYLKVDPSVIFERRETDTTRERPELSVSYLDQWQHAEISELRSLCIRHQILFSVVSDGLNTISEASYMVDDFKLHSEAYNRRLLQDKVDDLFAHSTNIETVLVIDGDQTLAAEDTGAMFWQRANVERPLLKNIFDSPLKYSYAAFRQAALLYEEYAQDYQMLCRQVAEIVMIRPEFMALLKHVSEYQTIKVVIVSCGIRLIWEMILRRAGLFKQVEVIAGSRLSDRYVVTGDDKTAIVKRMQNKHKKKVWAFGDSPLDLGMLAQADEAIVVVGNEQTRSKSMDQQLQFALRNGLVARQALLPPHDSPRANTQDLPIVQLDDASFRASITHSRGLGLERFFHATDRAACRILTTPMRNASIRGPALRNAHRQVGRYLAMEFVADIIGLETYAIRHVQGHSIEGFRLLREQSITLVALMRGGEPMAQGINDVFPEARMIHAKLPEDLKIHLLDGQSSVVLVDSVINTGKSIAQFVEHIRLQYATMPIVVVAGVIQVQSLAEGPLAQLLVTDAQLSLGALRQSSNMFTGSGGIDTGNRLFNTI